MLMGHSISECTTMNIKPGPHRSDADFFILSPGGEGTVKSFTPSFYQELDTEFNSFKGHLLVAQHSFDADWPTWEMHPHGDEMVCLIEGDIDFVLWRDGEEEVLRVNEAGTYVVVPKGIWHTARPRQQTTMLFITPGEGTLNAVTPGGEPL